MNETKIDNSTEESYYREYVPKVHKIGRITMVLGFVVTFLPVIYLFFIKGYFPGMIAIGAIVATMLSLALAGFLTESISYYPILGSAATYISYLAGNVSNMRVPVVLQIQNTLDIKPGSMKSQVIIPIALVGSVVSNLVILGIIVLAGTWLLSVLPSVVIKSFDFVVPSIIAAVMAMLVRNAKKMALYFVPFGLVIAFLPFSGLLFIFLQIPLAVAGNLVLAIFLAKKLDKASKA